MASSLGVVLGAAAFQIWRPTTCGSFAFAGTGAPVVFTAYEGAVRDAWDTVVARLEAEATKVGAHGVLGVAVTQTWAPGGSTGAMLQLQLLGTAVRLPGAVPLPRPFLSNLSSDDFLKLLIGGWVPCGLAWGVAAVHVHRGDASALMQGGVWANAELPVASAGVRLARDRVDEQARATLVRCRAAGAVEIRLEMKRHAVACGGNGQGVLIEGLLVGTGVVRYRSSLASPSVALNLRRDRSAKP